MEVRLASPDVADRDCAAALLAAEADARHLEEYQKLAQFGFALPGARELLEKLRDDRHPLWMATSAKA